MGSQDSEYSDEFPSSQYAQEKEKKNTHAKRLDLEHGVLYKPTWSWKYEGSYS